MRLGRDVDPEALRRFRESRGLTQEQLAEIVWASPPEVAAWEAGTLRVPREQARRIRDRERADRRHVAVTSAALPGCEWADAHAPGLHDILVAQPVDLSRLTTEARAHLDACPTCERVHRFGLGLRKLRADPGLGFDLAETLVRVFDSRRRIVLYPIALGGAGLVAAAAALLWARLPGWVREGLTSGAGLPLLWGAAAFAAAGVLLDHRLRGRPYLHGMLKSAVGVAAGLLAWNYQHPAGHSLSGPVLLGCGAAILGAGVLSGWWSRWRGDDQHDAEPAESNARAGERQSLTDAGPVELDFPPPTAPHLLPGTRVPGIDEVPLPRADGALDGARSR